jgi:hypothetical protein
MIDARIGHRIVSLAAQRVTSDEPFQREPPATDRAVTFDGLLRIDGTCRQKSAGAPDERPQEDLVAGQKA